ncbi:MULTISPECIES: hypothetical protein [unclassified Kitasatospora]|uniref:hypothetical protein n=1 Tax=unclassified Kitasatospora TaxID=2633591 RepID=UPI0033CE9A5B
MATSDGPVRLALRYLNSAKNLAGLAGAAVGVGLHQFELGGSLWPGVAAALYGVGALVAPGRKPDPPDPPGRPTTDPNPGPESESGSESESESESESGSGSVSRPVPVSVSVPQPAPLPDPELEALAAYLGAVPLPPTAGVDGLLTALREAGPGPVAERIVRHRLPLAVAGYLRARTWQPWAGPDAPDPAAELGREVVLLTAELS